MRITERVDDVAQHEDILDDEYTFGDNGDDWRAEALLNSESEIGEKEK